MIVATVILIALFVLQERRHAEPIIPMELFKRSIFSSSVCLAFLSGAALFGSIIYVPQFLQNVKGYSPTEAGLAMIPLTLGIMTTSIGGGILVSKVGRYKFLALIGTVVGAFGMFLLSLIKVDTSLLQIDIFTYLIGFGVGGIMQTPILAIQNDVEMRYMGTATSAAVFARGLGGSLGTALFGTIINNRTRNSLGNALPADQVANIDLDVLSHKYVQSLTSIGEKVPSAVFTAYTHAIHVAFLAAIPIMGLAVIAALVLKDKPLKTSVHGAPPPVVAE